MTINEPMFEYFNYISTEVLLIGIITVLLCWHSNKKFSYWKERNIPYVKSFPFIGSVLDVATTPLHDLELERYFSLGPIYGSFEGHRPVLVVGDPKLIRDVFIKDFPTFINRRSFFTGLKNFDLSILVNEGEDWKRIRSIISPAFSISKLKRLLGIFKECSETLVQNFKISAQKEESISVRRFFDAFILDVSASSIFSTKIDSFNDPANVFVQHVVKNNGIKFKLKMSLTLLFNSMDFLGKIVKVSGLDSSSSEFFTTFVKNIISE
ncbi:cytochrome P450 3A27-like [Parasteatoda tepidariorum]|uniref:cytochrome P450 3A27-like n=1 Tax=Parasteatoda tepidariorum TaxID=114398 RepID=UPI0039BD3F16